MVATSVDSAVGRGEVGGLTGSGALPPAPLSVRCDGTAELNRLTPMGELDLATVPILEREFDALCQLADDDRIIVVDLTQLSFMDAAGINLLIRMDAAIGRSAGRLRVINGSSAVERVLDLTGVRSRLPIISKNTDPLARLARCEALPSRPNSAGREKLIAQPEL